LYLNKKLVVEICYARQQPNALDEPPLRDDKPIGKL
jgi:hypothetical protein